MKDILIYTIKMKHLNDYQKFNEEIKLRDAILAGGLSLASALGNNTSAQPKQPVTQQQIKKPIVNDMAYKAVEMIESSFSYTHPYTGRIVGANYDGRAKEAVMRKYIDETIGLSNWFKINDQLRGQIYQYMFQHDSGSDKVAGNPDARRNWWISGLAQAIDPTIKRPSVNEKRLDNPAVRNAINIIVNAINDGTINGYYEAYKKVLDNQYSVTGSASKDDYKNIWRYRPIAFERLMNGDSWTEVKKDWLQSITGKQSTKKPEVPKQENIQYIKTPYLDSLYSKFKKFINTERQNNPNTKINIVFKDLKVEGDNLNLIFSYELGTGFDTYSILFNEVGSNQETLNKAKLANPGLRVVKSGVIRARANDQSTLKEYEFHLVGIDIN